MGNPIYQNINITNLLLNPSNPRYNPVEHQLEAIEAMIQDQKDKLVVLAKHIALYGLNPSDLIIVKPYNKQWIVCEGNRRITALKLVNEPSLVSSDFPKIKKEFQSLNLSFNKILLENIPCVILDDEDEINEWVRLKHTGQNEGSGTVSWDGQQTSRFRALAEGKPDMRLSFLDELRFIETIPQSIKDKLGNIKKTNFDRLIGDPDIRNILGIEIIENRIQLVNGVNSFLLAVLDDLVNDNLSVGTIYLKKDRLEYIESLKRRIAENTATQVITDDIDDHSSEDVQPYYGNGRIVHHDYQKEFPESVIETATDHKNSSRKKKQSYYINRKTLVPSPHKLTITHARILKIFNELKSIAVDDYPNAVAVLFRVFIELSVDCFITTRGLINSKLNVDSKLSQKIDAVAVYLESNNFMNKHELRAIRQMTASDNQTQSIRTFHSYVHNKDVTPSSADLKSAWDDIWPFIEKIWGDQ